MRRLESVIWALRVLDPVDQKNVLFEQFYPDKIVALKQNEDCEIEFDDLVSPQLDPGKYVLELTWYRFDADLGVASLQDPEVRTRLGDFPPIRTEIVLD